MTRYSGYPDLISDGEVESIFTSASSVMALADIYPDLVVPGHLSPIAIHMQLGSIALREVCCTCISLTKVPSS